MDLAESAVNQIDRSPLTLIRMALFCAPMQNGQILSVLAAPSQADPKIVNEDTNKMEKSVKLIDIT
jgi:hypothetical protein